MMVRKDIPPERMTKKGSPKWKKQRGFPETVARKATDEDMDGSRATLRVLARSHVAKGGSLPFLAHVQCAVNAASRRAAGVGDAAGFGAAGVANAAGFVTAGIASALHKSYEMVADSMFARFIRSVQKPPWSGATTPFTA